MITIVHGNDINASRNFYITKRQTTIDPVIFDGATLDYSKFYQTFEGDNLFESDKNVFVENFFSSKKSNSDEVKKIVEYVNSKKDLSLFFWESKELTKAQSVLIKNADVKQFSYPQILFSFLDSIKPNNPNLISQFKELENQMETELIFFMLIRQFRLLLGINLNSNIDEIKRMAPWQSGKISKQVRYFDDKALLKAYNDLYEIDYETKYGLSSLPTSARIDIFLSDL